MASLQDIEILQDLESLLQNVDPLFEDLQPLTSALTTSFQESIAIISSALFDTSSDLTTTFFTVLLMVLVATMARMVFEGRTTPGTELEKDKLKIPLEMEVALPYRTLMSYCGGTDVLVIPLRLIEHLRCYKALFIIFKLSLTIQETKVIHYNFEYFCLRCSKCL